MTRQLGDSALYKGAIEALATIKNEHGTSGAVKAIARFLLHSCRCEVPEPLFPYVGNENDERDRAHVAAYNEAFKAFINGDDDED